MGKCTETIERGYCSKDPEVKQSKAGSTFAKFSIMLSFGKKVNGEWQKGPVKFWDCIAFHDNARWVEANLRKGTKDVDLVGTLAVEEYNGKNYEKLLVDSISLHDGQTAHDRAKRNGFAPEAIVKEPEPVESGEDDAELCPF